MGNEKMYVNSPTLFKTKCVDVSECTYLYPKWYNVIAEDETRYLIQFNSGAAHWYSKSRFQGKLFLKT